MNAELRVLGKCSTETRALGYRGPLEGGTAPQPTRNTLSRTSATRYDVHPCLRRARLEDAAIARTALRA